MTNALSSAPRAVHLAESRAVAWSNRGPRALLVAAAWVALWELGSYPPTASRVVLLGPKSSNIELDTYEGRPHLQISVKVAAAS